MTSSNEPSTPVLVVLRRGAVPVIAALALLLAGCPGRDGPPQPTVPPKVLRACAEPRHLTCPGGKGIEPLTADGSRPLDPHGQRRTS